MTYLYYCPTCNKQTEITKSAKDSGREEKCPTCKTVMNRVWHSVGLRTAGDGVKI